MVIQRADFWEEKFHKRSYINATHIMIDAVEAFDKAYNVTSKTLKKLKKNMNTVYRKSMVEVKQKRQHFAELSKPYIAKLSELWATIKEQYHAHVKPEIQKATAEVKPHLENLKKEIRPHYEKHIAPLVHKAKPKIHELKVKATESAHLLHEQSRAAGSKAFSEAVSQVEKVCPIVLSAVLQTEKKLGVPAPRAIVTATQHACDEPEQAVDSFIKGAAVLLALLFWRPLYKLASTLLWVALRVAWWLFPLRMVYALLFAPKKVRSSKKAVDTKSKANGNLSPKSANGNKAMGSKPVAVKVETKTVVNSKPTVKVEAKSVGTTKTGGKTNAKRK
jgi:gas vesicle protein